MTSGDPSHDPEKRSSGVDLGVGMGIGAALGVALGVSLDNLALWLPIGIAMGAGIGMANSGKLGPPDGPDDDDEAQRGAIARALLWVLGGLVLAAGLFAAVSPELVGAAPGAGAGIIGLVLVAGVPGLLLLVLAAIRRRRLGLDHTEHARRTGPEER